MRQRLLLAAFALLPVAPLAAQPTGTASPPPAAPHLELTAEQRAELEQAVVRGRALALLLEASRISTADMLMRVPPDQRDAIVGWIARPEGNGVTVTYFAREGEGFAAVYRGQVLGGRMASPQVYASGSRPVLAGVDARMAAARMAAESLDNQPCGADAFNTLVMPPDGDGPVLVYQLSPRENAGSIPAGGHYRVTVAADGSIAQSTALAGRCENVTLPAVAAGQRPRPLVVNAREATLPNEIHVFLSLWAGRPLAVATGTDQVRLWGVTPEGIAELQQ